jgi:hypothetical protein
MRKFAKTEDDEIDVASGAPRDRYALVGGNNASKSIAGYTRFSR